MRLIDADALIKNRCHAKDFFKQPELYVIGQGYVMDAPTVDAVPVVYGEWIYHHWCEFKCSQCGIFSRSEPKGKEKYCFNCGAKMEREGK